MFKSIWEAFIFLKYKLVHTTISATAHEFKEETNKKSNQTYVF